MRTILNACLLLTIMLMHNFANAQMMPSFTTYNSNNTPFNYMGFSGVVKDQSGNVWVNSTEEGMVGRFDSSLWTVYNSNTSPLMSTYMTCLEADANSNMWFGTLGTGITKFDGTTWTTYTTSNSNLPSNSIRCVKKDKLGRVWIATGYGTTPNSYYVSMFNGSNWTSYQQFKYVKMFDFDNDNNMWVCARDSTYMVDLNTMQTSNKVYPNNVDIGSGVIKADNNGTMWTVGTASGSVYFGKFENGVWVSMTNRVTGIGSFYHPVGEFTSMAFDSENNMWVSRNETNGPSLLRYDGRIWSNYDYLAITGLLFDTNDDMWMSTIGGLYHYIRCNQTIVAQPQSIMANIGDNVSFTAQGSSANNTYAWYIDKNDGNGFNIITQATALGVYTGWDSNTLTITNYNNTFDQYQYMCVLDFESLCMVSTQVVRTNPPGGVATKELAKGSKYKIFPNPTSDYIHIETDEVISSVSLTNILGQVINPQHNNGTIDISNLPKGFYLINVNGNHRFKILKI